MSRKHHVREQLASRSRICGFAIAALLALPLGACQTDRELVARVPADYRLRHPVAIKEAERTVQLFVGVSGGGLKPSQRGDISSFAEAWRREGTGGIILDVPVGTANARAAGDVARDAQAMLMAEGVPPRSIEVRSFQPPKPDRLATVRMSYPRMAAQAGPCGFWPEDLGPSLDSPYLSNRPYWNLGCATQRNLAAMVQEPSDLVQPRGESPIYTSRRGTVLEKHRKGEDSSTVYRDPNKGTLSDVGRQ